MLDPRHLLWFSKVVECGSITAAARILNVPKATISRAIKRIETELSSRLLERTSRKFRLTDAGGTLFQHCMRIAAEIEDAEAAVGLLQGTARGTLRIAAPFTFGRFLLSPILAEFLFMQPEIQIDLELTNRRVDPIEENFDFVVRTGKLEDSILIVRKLGEVAYGLFASPKYLRTGTVPRQPMDLERHSLIGAFGGGDRATWTFANGNQEVTVRVSSLKLNVNDPMVRLDAAIAGVGVAVLPLWLVKAQKKENVLRRLLPEWQPLCSMSLSALYPNRRSLTIKSRVFLTFLEERIPAFLAC